MPTKDTSVIPQGSYCYDYIGTPPEMLKLGKLRVNTCPYWRSIEDQPSQANGYCDYLDKGDFDGSTFLLWDQCKECGINLDE